MTLIIDKRRTPFWLQEDNRVRSSYLGLISETDKYVISRFSKNILKIKLKNNKKNNLFYVKIPISKYASINTEILKILYENGFLDEKTAIHHFERWRKEKSTIILEHISKHGIRNFIQPLPIRRRGNEHYSKYTWSKLQGNIMVFNGFPLIYEPTSNTIPYKSFNRKIIWCNTFFLTITFSEQNPHKLWRELTKFINKYMTSLKQKLIRRNNKLEYYIKANESHKDYRPHIHLLLKLRNPIPCYKYWSRKKKRVVTTPFPDHLYFKYPFKEFWRSKHGYTDLEAMNTSKKSINYIMKYITKTINFKDGSLARIPPRPDPQSNEAANNVHSSKLKSLAMTWINRKRLYSTSMFCHLKHMYPALDKAYSDLPNITGYQYPKRLTVNRLRELYYERFNFPKVAWSMRTDLKELVRYPQRVAMDQLSTVSLKLSLELKRLNNEGSWRVIAMRTINQYGEEVFSVTPRVSKEPPPEKPPDYVVRIRESPTNRPWKQAKADLKLLNELKFGMR